MDSDFAITLQDLIDIEIKIQLSLILILSSHVVRETSCWLLCCC